MQERLFLSKNTLAERVKAARKFRDLTQEALAELIGARQSDISKIERGDIERTTYIISLATALRCDPQWMDTGFGTPPWVETNDKTQETSYKSTDFVAKSITRNLEFSHRSYPLLSSIQAGSWGVVDVAPSDILEMVNCPVDLGAEGFCLRVEGDSMTTTEGLHSFPEGINVCFLAVSEANHKDFVCVVREGETNAVFKQLIKTEDGWFLHSLNPNWPKRFVELREGDRITGRLKYAGWQF